MHTACTWSASTSSRCCQTCGPRSRLFQLIEARKAQSPIAQTQKAPSIADHFERARRSSTPFLGVQVDRSINVDDGPYARDARLLMDNRLPAARHVARIASDVAPRMKRTNYPEPFASRVAGREKRALGDPFGLANFGVNLTRLAPGAMSSVRHAHSRQDEFVYVLRGSPTLYTDEGPTRLAPGMCAGFKANSGNAHHLVNETAEDVEYLEVGDRTPGDAAIYPDDDLSAQLDPVSGWRFTHKDGTPY